MNWSCSLQPSLLMHILYWKIYDYYVFKLFCEELESITSFFLAFKVLFEVSLRSVPATAMQKAQRSDENMQKRNRM